VNLVGDPLELMPGFGLLLVLLFGESVQVLLMPLLLLLVADPDRSQILLEFSLVDSIFVLNVLKGDLSLFLQLSELIKILEDQMLAPLLVDFDLNLMLLGKILELSFLVSQLSLLIF